MKKVGHKFKEKKLISRRCFNTFNGNWIGLDWMAMAPMSMFLKQKERKKIDPNREESDQSIGRM